MDKKQIRARLEAISARLSDIMASADMTDEMVSEMETLNAEFQALSTRLTALETTEATLAKANSSTGRKTEPETPVKAARVEVGASATDKFGGFKSTGDFLMAVRQASEGKFAPQFQNAMYEKRGEDGGFLVPEEMATAIYKKLDTPIESFLSSTTQLKTGGNNMSINIDESQPWNQGVQAYWIDEGDAYKETKGKLTQADFKLKKLGALCKPTDELMEDAIGLESWMMAAAPNAMMYKLNSAILVGDGVGKPSGLLNSPFTVNVAKESAQAADSIVPANVIKMYSHMFAQARANAVWFIEAGVEEQLLGMKDDDGRLIYISPGGELNQTPYGRLLGRPVIPLMYGLPALGDSGDILFANLSYYYSLTKAGSAGIKSAQSIHLHFDRDITTFKFTMRVDGKVPFKSPVTSEKGAYQQSAFVKLADRA